MDIRNSFSRLKKKLKHPLTGSGRKSGRTLADVGGGNETNTGGHQVNSTDRPVEPESEPAHGTDEVQEGGVANSDGGVDQRYSYLRSDVVVTVGSERGREGGVGDGEKTKQEVYLSPSAPSISTSEGPDGA